MALAAFSPSTLRAEDGQADLDKATELKLNAESLDELADVINLSQRALDKGLDADGAKFAKQLLASTLAQRGMAMTEAIFSPEVPDPRWQQMRRLALADLERSVRELPEQPELWLTIARLHALPGGDAERLIAAIDEAIKVAKDDKKVKFDALLMRASVRENLADKAGDLSAAIELKPDDPHPLRARGALYMASDKPDKALLDFDAALKIDPKHSMTHEARGAALAMLNRLDESRASYAKALEFDPKATSVRMQRAQIAMLEGKFEEAIEDATKVIEIDSTVLAARVLRAQAYMRLERYDDSLADIDSILKVRPGLRSGLRLKAQIHASQNKVDEAISDLKEILRADPADVETQYQIGMLYRGQKNYTKALAIFDEIVKNEPEAWFVRYGRAETYLSIGKHRQALADYDLVLKDNGEDSGMLNNFAWLLCTSPMDEVRDGKRAIELATKACELTKFKAAHILSTLAAAYAETGDYANALKWSRKALELCDKDLRDHMQKEVASYESSKPWREILREDQEVSRKPGDDQR